MRHSASESILQKLRKKDEQFKPSQSFRAIDKSKIVSIKQKSIKASQFGGQRRGSIRYGSTKNFLTEPNTIVKPKPTNSQSPKLGAISSRKNQKITKLPELNFAKSKGHRHSRSTIDMSNSSALSINTIAQNHMMTPIIYKSKLNYH